MTVAALPILRYERKSATLSTSAGLFRAGIAAIVTALAFTDVAVSTPAKWPTHSGQADRAFLRGSAAGRAVGDRGGQRAGQGEGADLQEGVSCFDAETGKLLWQHLENDFLSDTIYLRYATSAPATAAATTTRCPCVSCQG